MLSLFQNLEATLKSPSSQPILSEALEATTWDRLRRTSFGQQKLADLFDTAEKLLQQPFEPNTFQHFMRYYRDGDRLDYETRYFNQRQKLETYALAILAGGETKYLTALENCLWAICDEYSWCFPAHMPLQPAEGQWDHRHFVDLFASETAFALSEIRNLLGHRLAPELCHRIKREVLDRVVDSWADNTFDYQWSSTTSNWAAVCAGSVGAAALYLVEDPRRLAAILTKLAGPLSHYLEGFAEDGACTEGMGYWIYGFSFYVSFADLLARRTGGRVDLLRAPLVKAKIEAICLFPQRSRLFGRALVSFADSFPPYRYPLGVSSYLAGFVPGMKLPGLEVAETLVEDHARRWCKHVRDFVWFNPDAPLMNEETTDGHHYFPDAQWLVVRKAGQPSFGFAAKGGHNEEPHNHNDIGSFLLVRGQDTFLADLGAGLYDRAYFGPGRYDLLVNASRGHSVPLIDGVEQAFGKSFAAKQTRHRHDGDDHEFSMDLAGAYPVGPQSLIRTFGVNTGPLPWLKLKDTYDFPTSGFHTLRERFVTELEVTKTDSSSVVIQGIQGILTLKADRPPTRIEVVVEHYLEHHGASVPVWLVDFVYEETASHWELSFEFS